MVFSGDIVRNKGWTASPAKSVLVTGVSCAIATGFCGHREDKDNGGGAALVASEGMVTLASQLVADMNSASVEDSKRGIPVVGDMAG